MDVSGSVLDVSGTVPPPEVITFADLLSDHSLVVSKEQADRDLINTIGVQNVMGLRPKLVEWVMKGAPNAYPILSLNIQPPSLCSDGVVRDLPSYIEFCSGKPIHDHVALLQAKLPDMDVSFANFSGVTTVVVSKI